MATWTNIPDSSIEPGKPIRSIDGIALRDNPIAIAQGAAGAPRIAGQQGPAVETGGIANSAVTTSKIANGNVTAEKLATGNNERDWVLARTAAAGVGAVGTYAVAWNTTTSNVNRGATVVGSSLRVSTGFPKLNPYSTVSSGLTTSFPTQGTATLSGTWRALAFSSGRVNIGSLGEPNYQWHPTLWLRIS